MVEVVEDDERRHRELLLRLAEHLSDKDRRLDESVHLRFLETSGDPGLLGFALLVL